MALDMDLSCPDWWEKLQRGETPLPAVEIDKRRAGVAVRAFNQLCVPDVPGQPTFGEVGGEWFREIIATLFGCIDPETDERAISELFLLVPKKNSKTTNAAALGLVWLLLNRIPNVFGLILGPTQKISAKAFTQAQGMINADAKLRQLLQVQEHRGRIRHVLTGAVLEIKTFDMKVVTGEIPVFTLLDEVHLLSTLSYAKKVIGQLRGGMTKDGSMLIMITTQSAEEPAGVFRSELNHARRVRDGELPADGLLPVLYEFPEEVQTAKGAPFMDPKMWPMVLPNLGLSVKMPFLERLLRLAQAKGKDDVQLWLSQHLNIQIGLGLHSDRWVGADYWEDCAGDDLTLEALMQRSEVCVVGIDGGGLDDLLGLAVLGRCAETGAWLHWGKAWVQPDVMQARPEIAERLQDFADDGDLTICDFADQDVGELADICAELNDAGLLPEKWAIGLDPEGVADIVGALSRAGLQDEQITAISQGYKLNAAINGLPRKLKKGGFVHGGRRLMAWCVGNAKTELRGNARMVTKARSGLGKIDPLMALFDAVMLMARNPEAAGNARDLSGFLDNPVMVV